MNMLKNPFSKGKRVRIRAIQPSDTRGLKLMHRRLSPDSLYKRYLRHTIPDTTEIRQICMMRQEEGDGFVVTSGIGDSDVVGMAFYVVEPNGNRLTAEPALIIEDKYQGQGIGSRLFKELAEDALRQGIQRFQLVVDQGNTGMLRIVQNSGYYYEEERAYGAHEITVWLDSMGGSGSWF